MVFSHHSDLVIPSFDRLFCITSVIMHRYLYQFSVFCSSYPYEAWFFVFFAHRRGTRPCFLRFSSIVPLRKLLFSVFRWLYPVSEQFFPKIDDLPPYLSSFSRKSTIYCRIWAVFLRKLMIYPRVWTVFPEKWWFTPVSELFFMKT